MGTSAVELAINTWGTAQSRCRVLVCLALVLLPIVMLHVIKSPSGCAYIQKSCIDVAVCEACTFCRDPTEPKEKFCYYWFLGDGNKNCVGNSFRKTICNLGGGRKDCTKPGADPDIICANPALRQNRPIIGGVNSR